MMPGQSLLDQTDGFLPATGLENFPPMRRDFFLNHFVKQLNTKFDNVSNYI